jgi:ribonuclease T2
MPERFKTLITGVLFIFLTGACGRSEHSRQESYFRPAQEGRRSYDGRQQHAASTNRTADFDYYVLSLSWAPTFCAAPQHRSARECEAQQHAGFVVHGLWPQREDERAPEDCGVSRPLEGAAKREALALFPDPGLAQHEWTAHGTCSGLSPETYFETLRRAREKLTIPAPYREPQRGLRTRAATVEQRFARASNIPPEAIRVHCVRNELAEVRFCLTKSLNPRPCSRSVPECHTGQILMPPAR